MKFIAHRGESETAPENTLEAYALAWCRGLKCIEGDFYLTRDDKIICLHDSTFNRVCGVNKSPAELTLDEIKQLDAGKYKGTEWSYTRIPTLEEIFKMIPEYGEIFLEPKHDGSRMITRIRQIFDSTPLRQQQLTFLVGDSKTIETIRCLLPGAKILWCTINWSGDWEGVHSGPRFTPEEMVTEARRLGVDGIDIHTEFISHEYVIAMHEAGFSFNIWVVDDPRDVVMYQRWGVDAITSNRVYALQQELLC